MFGSIKKLRKAADIAELLIAAMPKVLEAMKLLREFEVRNGRDAKAGDLDDNIAKIETLLTKK